MTNREILSRVDHTLLRPDASLSDIFALCDEAERYVTASACIPPSYVAAVREKYPALNICTVIGFPLGYDTTATKCAALREAVGDGAAEVDVVVNLGDVKNGDFDKITAEIAALKEAAAGRILKIIIETCYLTGEEKRRLCQCVTEGGADYIKTSTGFGTGGATFEDARLLKANVGPRVAVKASGGIRTR